MATLRCMLCVFLALAVWPFLVLAVAAKLCFRALVGSKSSTPTKTVLLYRWPKEMSN